jgi:two-component system, NtrC family, sensor kinase
VRLATKLAMAAVLILVAIFGYRAYETTQRELARARADRLEAQFIIGRALRPAIREIWRLEGPKRALQVLNIADERIQRARKVRIAWVPFHPLPSGYLEIFGRDDFERLKRSDETTIVRMGTDRLFTYLPLHVGAVVEGALEISEALSPAHARWREEVSSTLTRTGLGAAISILAVSALGFVMVGRPMRRLNEFAKRIGTGDLHGVLQIRQRDEIGELAAEMNQMCTRLRLANQRLQEESTARIGALEQLRHADRLKTVGTLASGIAHELGTPLNVVSGRAKMVASGEVNGAEAAESCRIIVDQVDRITKIIRQLLDFARRRSPDRGPYLLAGLAGQTLSLLEPMASKRGVSLCLEEQEPGVQAEVDAAQIQQALANLVVNGVQAMDRGGRLTVAIARSQTHPPPEVPESRAGFARVAVHDQGVGIPAELIPRVFEPFFTTKDVGQGTGLGLSVAFGIARDHGGWIAVDSAPGRGSRFELFVPLQPPAERST